jgi:hypothetical protein
VAAVSSTFDLIIECVTQTFELDDFTYGPNTDLVFVSSQFEPERLEWAIDALGRRRKMEWPLTADANGRLCRAQLFLPESLTVAELCQIVDSGKWPTSWTRPNKVLSSWSFG